MVFTEKPVDFDDSLVIVSCFCEWQNRILLLKRARHKPQPETWGVPAGKLHDSEHTASAILRELKEETGIIVSPTDMHYHSRVFVRYPEIDFVYHMFRANLRGVSEPPVKINIDEHTEYKWLNPIEALKLNLIPDEDCCIKTVFSVDPH